MDSSTTRSASTPPALSGVAAGHAVEGHHPRQQHHFFSMDQQFEASTLGMWVFLVTEIMFFGGLFMAYLMYRWAQSPGAPGLLPALPIAPHPVPRGR